MGVWTRFSWPHMWSTIVSPTSVLANDSRMISNISFAVGMLLGSLSSTNNLISDSTKSWYSIRNCLKSLPEALGPSRWEMKDESKYLYPNPIDTTFFFTIGKNEEDETKDSVLDECWWLRCRKSLGFAFGWEREGSSKVLKTGPYLPVRPVEPEIGQITGPVMISDRMCNWPGMMSSNR